MHLAQIGKGKHLGSRVATVKVHGTKAIKQGGVAELAEIADVAGQGGSTRYSRVYQGMHEIQLS